MENIKPEIKEEKHVFDEEMRAKILERQKEAEHNPDRWINFEEFKQELEKV